MTFVLSFIFPPLLLMGQNLTVRDRLSVKWAYCHVQTVKFEGGAPVEFHFLLIAASAAAQAEGRRFEERFPFEIRRQRHRRGGLPGARDGVSDSLRR
jgi:hypothetical protein